MLISVFAFLASVQSPTSASFPRVAVAMPPCKCPRLKYRLFARPVSGAGPFAHFAPLLSLSIASYVCACSTKVKIYGGAGATVEEVRQEHAVVIPKFMRHLAPEHQRITQSVVTFHAITPGVQPSGIFYPASTCAC
jgi:hypothetical protein